MEQFAKATTFSPMDGSHPYNVACMQALLGKTKEALGNRKKAFMLDPSLQELAKKDDDLRAL